MPAPSPSAQLQTGRERQEAQGAEVRGWKGKEGLGLQHGKEKIRRCLQHMPCDYMPLKLKDPREASGDGSAGGCAPTHTLRARGRRCLPGAAMEKSYMSMFLLLMAISCVLAKDIGKKETKETSTKPKLPQTLSRGKNT